jgi:hypothetical protein
MFFRGTQKVVFPTVCPVRVDDIGRCHYGIQDIGARFELSPGVLRKLRRDLWLVLRLRNVWAPSFGRCTRVLGDIYALRFPGHQLPVLYLKNELRELPLDEVNRSFEYHHGQAGSSQAEVIHPIRLTTLSLLYTEEEPWHLKIKLSLLGVDAAAIVSEGDDKPAGGGWQTVAGGNFVVYRMICGRGAISFDVENLGFYRRERWPWCGLPGLAPNPPVVCNFVLPAPLDALPAQFTKLVLRSGPSSILAAGGTAAGRQILFADSLVHRLEIS